MSNPNPSNSDSSPSEFSHALTKTTVAQILKSTGFKSSKSSALETLTRVAALFLHHLTSSAASLSPNPSLHHLLSALQNLDFPLDFSLLPLSRFLSSHHRPFPRRVPKPLTLFPHPVALPGDSTVTRGPEIPNWLPSFPAIKVDNGDNGDGGDDGEVYWEAMRGQGCEVSSTAAVTANGKGAAAVSRQRRAKRDMAAYGRRERVKFRIGSVAKAKTGIAGNDIELSNGACRGW